jgi:hypothetical protein
MNAATKFLALSPVTGVRYSVLTLYAYGRLDEHQDTHSTAIWVDAARRVWGDGRVGVDNPNRGRRTAPELVG